MATAPTKKTTAPAAPLDTTPAAAIVSTSNDGKVAAADAAPAVLDDTPVRVFNNNVGEFTHGEYSVKGKGFATVPKYVADLWMSHLSGGLASVISADDVPAARPNTAALEAQLTAKDVELVNLRQMIANLEAAALAGGKSE